MSGNSKTKIAFNYLGSKFCYVDEIISYFPTEFNHLCELFAGSFVVALNYDRKVIKTANDINEDVINFFEVLRNHTPELLRLLELTPVHTQEFDRCYEPCHDKIEKARRFYVKARQSYYGLGSQQKNKGVQLSKSSNEAESGEAVSRWNNSLEKIWKLSKDLRTNYQFMNYDYAKAIDKMDCPTTFFFCDPPYLKKTRKSEAKYNFEFSEKQHIELAEKLHKIEGKAMVCGYDSELYNKELYKNWIRIGLNEKENQMTNKKIQEVIWINYEPPQYQQLNLFK